MGRCARSGTRRTRRPGRVSEGSQRLADGLGDASEGTTTIGQQENSNYMSLARSSVAMSIVLAFCAAFGLAALILAALGSGERGTDVALQMTARLSFLLFWPAYTGSVLTTLFEPAFEPIKRRTREFGLAFASAHLVHLALVAWLIHIGAAPPLGTFVVFGVAVVWTYLPVLFSIDRLQQTMGSWSWWALRVVGLNCIAYAFALDFLRYPQFGSFRYLLSYLPFAVLSVFGPLLRLAAFMQRAASHGAR
jgi:hypothetical protein